MSSSTRSFISQFVEVTGQLALYWIDDSTTKKSARKNRMPKGININAKTNKTEITQVGVKMGMHAHMRCCLQLLDDGLWLFCGCVTLLPAPMSAHKTGGQRQYRRNAVKQSFGQHTLLCCFIHLSTRMIFFHFTALLG